MGNRYAALWSFGVVCVGGLALAGCAETPEPQEVRYVLTSDPPGAEVYKGAKPAWFAYYQTTPYEVTMLGPVEWWDWYFQARKPGYHDSEIHQEPQPDFSTREIAIHLELEPKGDEADLAPYRSRDTLEGYYEFLSAYPASPHRGEVFERMADRIEETESPLGHYRILLDDYPDAADHVPLDRRAELAEADISERREMAAAEAESDDDGDTTAESPSGPAEVPDDDAGRIEQALAQQTDELDQRRAVIEDLWDRQDRLANDLRRRAGMEPPLDPAAVDDAIADRAVPFCIEQHGRRAWESDPQRMERQCRNELDGLAGPLLRENASVQQDIDRLSERYSELYQEREELQQSAEQWADTGAAESDLLMSVLRGDYDPTATGGPADPPGAPAAGGEPDFAAAGGSCAAMGGMLDRLRADVAAHIRTTHDECDHQYASYLAALWQRDITHACHEAGVPEITAEHVALTAQTYQESAQHMDRVDQFIGCQYNRTLLNAEQQWNAIAD